jgi:putative transcriptional regulator
MYSTLYTVCMGIKSNLRRIRLAADGMTQQELARRVGVTRQTILSIEKSKFRPSVELALLLAQVFSIKVEELFELIPEEVEE